jgi:beta-glucosidase
MVKNTGEYDGSEVVQLYVNDVVSSVTQYEKQLRGFDRVSLKTGEEKTVSFVISPEDIALNNRDMNFVVEPGKFNIFIGSSSTDIRLEGSFILTDKQLNEQ